MGFEDFLGESISESGESEDLKNVEGEDEEVEDLNIAEESERIGPTQFYGIITSNKPDWQSIIYDLIHTEQLNPWDIDIVV